jgi:hypothetical protein
MEVDLEHAAVADMRPPVIGHKEVQLAGIVVGVAARREFQVLDSGCRVVDLMAVSSEDVELLRDGAAVVYDPDARAEAAADIEDVVTRVIGQRLGNP